MTITTLAATFSPFIFVVFAFSGLGCSGGLYRIRNPHFLLLPCCLCAVLSMAAITLFLGSMNDYLVSCSDMVWVLWSAFPLCLAMFLGFALGFFITFGNLRLDDFYS